MTEVESRVRAAIADHGPIGFDEYMTLALYGPGGFFEHPPVGSHFVTAPHVHPFVFAHCVRDALLDTWHALGEPEPFRVVELGAGDGTLATALLEAFAELPMPHVDYVGVEISPGARGALAARGLVALERLDDLEPFEGALFANELLDNLPFVPVRGRSGVLAEVRVGVDADGRLAEVEVPWSRGDLPAPTMAEGEGSTVPVGAFAMLDAVAGRLRAGAVLLIDYGRADGPAGSVRGYRGHREVADVLAQPGATDITAGVDWASVIARARALGLQTFGPITQAAALDTLGHSRWEATMREAQSRLQRSGRDSEAVRVWEARSRASLLVDPSGLGGSWWTVLATSGMREPAWLNREG
ncbi:MAG TPA: SAM-dependent methyltransferase [Actinomycetota bacterium]|jgi:NADH dehydrogenase [ubiquinone] 1 alpha subcomplex assembly factor 7|nr:SAM-dependent methyltransferase [Actinomycetota bacterium]